MAKPVKRAKYLGTDEVNFQNFIIDVDKDLFSVVQYLDAFPKVYIQSGIPTIPNDTIAIVSDTATGKYYIAVNVDGTQKKVELT